MNAISVIINTFTPEEKKEVLELLSKKNKRHDTKNIQLFELLMEEGNRKNLDILMYGKPSKNAYHALCKRLHDTLIEYVAVKRFKNESSEEMEVLKQLVASRFFLEHKKYALGFKTIDKAALKAKKYGFYTILNEIYYTKIQYAHQNQKDSLEYLITQFKTNQQFLKQEENLVLFYATVKYELQLNRQKITHILETNLRIFDISVGEHLSYKSLFKILEIVTETANISRDYNGVLKFVEKAYSLLQKEERLIEKELFYHIQILYYIANSYFRNKHFSTSQKYVNDMYNEMKAGDAKYYKRFFPQYTLLQALNLNYTGRFTEAISILEEFEYSKYKDQISYVLDLKQLVMVFYFQQAKFKEALKVLNTLTHSDTWYTQKTDNLWVIRKNFIEILVYIELEYIDLVESRIKSFRKKHIPYLNSKKENEVIHFFKLITEIYLYPKNCNTTSFMTKVNQLDTAISPEESDIFNLSFYAWIKAKIEGVEIYDTTLKLLNCAI